MTTYYTDVAVSPPIPLADMTPLERLYLSEAFDEYVNTSDGTATYEASQNGVHSIAMLDRTVLVAAIEKSRAHGCALVAVFEEALSAHPDGEVIDIWFDELTLRYADVLQSIVRRSQTVERFFVNYAFTCDKSDPDGVGGAVDLIEADRIETWSTYEQIRKWLKSAAA